MAEPGQLPSDGETRAADDIDEVLSRANPNPNGIGCPPRETLVALARRTLPIEDPAYGHLVQCSPCYREFRALQTGAGLQADPPRRLRRLWIAVGTAAVLGAAAGATWWARDRSEPTTRTAEPANLQAELDLRPFAVLRGSGEDAARGPLVLPRGVVRVTILLPTGSEAGKYEIQVLNSDLKSLAGAQASGEIQDFVATVRSTLDLRAVPVGAYQLAVRRTGEDWRLFPARVE
jgi:hypothetical protein